jgi:membrane protease YdiL (CAAX protease family)
MHKIDSKPHPRDRAELWGLALALLLPSVLTWCYFVALAESPRATQQAVYALGKIVQFGFPLAFVVLVAREPVQFRWRWRSGLHEGVLSGIVIMAFIIGLWSVLARTGATLVVDLVPNVSAKIASLGVATPLRYASLTLFYSVVHTFLEEYYWRWFVFARLRRRTSLNLSIALSSVGFMAHHIIVMGVYAGRSSPYTYIFSVAVAIGGAYWAWLYERSKTLVAPWVSHFFVDVAIFGVGYTLLS